MCVDLDTNLESLCCKGIHFVNVYAGVHTIFVFLYCSHSQSSEFANFGINMQTLYGCRRDVSVRFVTEHLVGLYVCMCFTGGSRH